MRRREFIGGVAVTLLGAIDAAFSQALGRDQSRMTEAEIAPISKRAECVSNGPDNLVR